MIFQIFAFLIIAAGLFIVFNQALKAGHVSFVTETYTEGL